MNIAQFAGGDFFAFAFQVRDLYGRTPEQVVNFYKEAIRRVKQLPAVDEVAVGTTVPWRDAGVRDSKGCGSAMRVAPIGLALWKVRIA